MYCNILGGTFDLTIGYYYGELACIECNLDAHTKRGTLRMVKNFIPTSTQELVDHIKEHEEVGHKVPAYLVEDLLRDDATNFPKT